VSALLAWPGGHEKPLMSLAESLGILEALLLIIALPIFGGADNVLSSPNSHTLIPLVPERQSLRSSLHQCSLDI
jgi:hypothetical protein